MHFEILVEDQSGKRALEVLIPKIVGNAHSICIHAYKGIGHIPKGMKDADDASRRVLLENLPKLLKGYGRTFAGYSDDYPAVVILVCDLDDKCLKEFRRQLFDILNKCNPKPETRFCIAIEEGEAWLLGDIAAVKSAYPKAKDAVLSGYTNDSICGTWELLADAVYPGGAESLRRRGWRAIGHEKSVWAENITPEMDVNNNRSPSFNYFREKMQELVGVDD